MSLWYKWATSFSRDPVPLDWAHRLEIWNMYAYSYVCVYMYAYIHAYMYVNSYEQLHLKLHSATWMRENIS